MNRDARTRTPSVLNTLQFALLALLLVACPVNTVNRTPTADNTTVTTPEDTAVAITLTAIDPDGDDLTYTVTSDPDHGTLSGTPPNLTYAPDASYAGLDAFTFTANDGRLDSNEATVTIDVSATNDPPTALNQTLTTSEDTPVVITLTAIDPDGDDLTYTVTSDPDHGTLSGTPPNLTYAPDASYAGLDAFTFTANDGRLDSNEATVTIDVSGTNDPPTGLTLDPDDILENEPAGTLIGTLTTGDPDVSDDHTYTLVPGPGSEDNDDFAITNDTLQTTAPFDHETTPTKTVRIRTTDTFGASLEQSFTITVSDVNEVPTSITLDPDGIPENQPPGTLVGTLSTTDPDTGDAHSYRFTSGDGDDDNNRFTITDDELRSAERFDYETTPALSVRILSQDQGGLVTEQAISIAVGDVAEPALSVAPTSATVAAGGAPQVFTATLVDSSDTITWALSPAIGSISPTTGATTTYTPPETVAASTTVTLSASAGSLTVSATITIRPESTPTPEFDIEIVFFDESFTSSQRAAFVNAASRWEGLVVGDLQDVTVDLPASGSCGLGEPAYAGAIDDLLIYATSFTDEVGGLLGSAGPCLYRSSGTNAGTNLVGFMQFDTADLANLEAQGALVDVIVHEMGHVLGFGTNWEFPPYFDLLDYVASDGASRCRNASGFVLDPTFIGASGVAGWNALGGSGSVPVEETGGPGTQCGHWDDLVFGSELMTGYLNVGGANPLSAMTVRSLEDLGLTVDASAADSYALPSGAALRTPDELNLMAAEELLLPRGSIDPATGRLDSLPVAPNSR